MKLISEAYIQTLAGDAAYQRGLDYYNDGKVTNYVVQGDSVRAEVRGSDLYVVELRHTAKIFEGSCSCPASDHFDFCKHCVAVALLYYYQTQTNQEISDLVDLDPVEHYVSTLTKPELVEELFAVIKNDPSTYEIWQLRAKLAGGQLSAKELRKHITKALPFKSAGLWRYADVAQYFAQAEQRIRALQTAITSIEANDSIKLLVYAYERIEKALHTIDDSGGYRFDLLALLKEALHTALSHADIDADGRITWLTSFYTNSKFSYELLRDDLNYSQLLDTKQQAALFKALLSVWRKQPPPEEHELYSDTPLHRLESALTSFAQSQQDHQLELEILAKSAINIDRSLALVSRCIELQRLDDANQWQKYASQLEGLRLRDISALEYSQIQIWLAEENYDEALPALWQIFAEQESLASAQEVLACADRIAQRALWLDKLISHLNANIDVQTMTQRDLARSETLVSLYLTENMIDQAVAFTSGHQLNPGTLMAVVNKSAAFTNIERSIAERATNHLIDLGSQQTYERALGFLRKIAARHSSNIELANLINAVYQRPENKRKSNFVKLLKQDFLDVLD